MTTLIQSLFEEENVITRNGIGTGPIRF